MKPIHLVPIVFEIACQPSKIEYIDETLSPFTLIDVNPTSDSFDTSVSTEQFSANSPELISAWYFGHST
jgi:hypothetical protein